MYILRVLMQTYGLPNQKSLIGNEMMKLTFLSKKYNQTEYYILSTNFQYYSIVQIKLGVNSIKH